MLPAVSSSVTHRSLIASQFQPLSHRQWLRQSLHGRCQCGGAPQQILNAGWTYCHNVGFSFRGLLPPYSIAHFKKYSDRGESVQGLWLALDLFRLRSFWLLNVVLRYCLRSRPPVINSVSEMISWVSEAELPPLPRIENRKYSDIVFSHSSANQRQRSSGSLDAIAGDADLDNGKLEHVGDGLVGSFVTLLLNELYPDVSVGAATSLKARLVSNATHAKISSQYGLPSRLRAGHAAMLTLVNNESVQADLFEAYIGGLFYSYLHTGAGLSRVTYGSASDMLESWLRPLYTPLAHRMLEEMRQGQALEDVSTDLERKALGATAMLNQHCTIQEAGLPKYEYSGAADKAGMWSCLCRVARKDGTQLSSEARSITKKTAATIAAYKVCQQMGLVA